MSSTSPRLTTLSRKSGAPLFNTRTHEPPVGRDERIAPFDRQGEIHAIVGRVIEIQRQRHGTRGNGSCGDELDIGAHEKLDGEGGFVPGKLTATDLLPQDIGALRYQQIRGAQGRTVDELDGMFRPRFIDRPLDYDARIDDERRHLSALPSL